MAWTTCGWQWPVEQTATPALQSKNMLPSTSSTQTPLARSATSLNEGRGYDGFTNWASASMIFLPFGPGSSVLISGLRAGAITPVDMFVSPCQRGTIPGRKLLRLETTVLGLRTMALENRGFQTLQRAGYEDRTASQRRDSRETQ